MRGLRGIIIVFLALVGVAAATLRIIYPDDFITRFEPHRHQIFEALDVNDPFADQRPAELARIEGRRCRRVHRPPQL